MGRKYKVILQPVKFRKREHLAIACSNSPEIDDIVREFEHVEWSTGYRFWHLPLEKNTLKKVTEALKDIAVVEDSAFKNYEYKTNENKKLRRKRIHIGKPTKEQEEQLDFFRQQLISSGYSEGTVKVYQCMLKMFFAWLKNKEVHKIANDDLVDFMTNYIDENKFTMNYKRLMNNALKRYYSFLGRTDMIFI